MNIRVWYLYLFSFIGLLIVVIGLIQLVNLGLNVYVFQGADQYDYYGYPRAEDFPELSAEELAAQQAEQEAIAKREVLRQRQRQLSNVIAMIVVGAPLYIYHWRIINREQRAK